MSERSERIPRIVDLLYSDVEEQLRDSVRDLLSARAPASATIARTESAEPYDPALWSALAHDLGVAGLAVGEDAGGHGASWREVSVVAEELGRSVAPTPFLGSAVLAVAAAQAAGASDLLRRLATAEVTATIAAPLTGSPHAAASALTLSGAAVHGTLHNVVDAPLAQLLLVPVRSGDTTVLLEVEVTATTLTPVESLDMTRPLTDVTFDGAPARTIAEGADADRAIKHAWAVGSVMLAAEQLGLAQRCLELTVEYVKTRYQFGRPIGSYQALKHRLADLWAAISQARAVVRYAAACVADGDPDTAVALSLAQAYCSPLAVKAAEECVQLHGGIGFTWEHPAHLYLKRAKADSALFGPASAHRARLGGLVDLCVS